MRHSRKVTTLGLAGICHSARQEVGSEPWVDVKCEVGCCHAATGTAFRQAGFTPRRAVQADDYCPAQGFVEAGLGISPAGKHLRRRPSPGSIGLPGPVTRLTCAPTTMGS